MENDTIAAISTGPGEAGIGIIRVSGDNAISAVNRIYINKKGEHTLSSYRTHTIHYGYIESNDCILDEVMVSIMKSPSSYTCEDIVEINCHGGITVCKKILEAVLEFGVRIAEPGEFTKRAFLNGRIDLTRAEAVMDTIKAQSDNALQASVNQLRGSLYTSLNNICSDIKYEIAYIEAAIDDPDSISLDGYSERLQNKISGILVKINELIRSYDEGRIISEGINTVILGKPNAGKSSLMNAMLDEERAIVTDIPGTTRDTLSEKIRLGDIVLNITDTAGIRETDDPIESIGVTKAKKAVNEADLLIYICDSTSALDSDDVSIINLLKNKKVIVLLNKNDLPEITDSNKIEKELNKAGVEFESIIHTSMTENTGLDRLKDEIRQMFYLGKVKQNDQITVTNLRHVNLLKKAAESLNNVQTSIENNMPEDFLSIDLTDAYTSLAMITGTEVTEDIVNEIFSKFCMGK